MVETTMFDYEFSRYFKLHTDSNMTACCVVG